MIPDDTHVQTHSSRRGNRGVGGGGSPGSASVRGQRSGASCVLPCLIEELLGVIILRDLGPSRSEYLSQICVLTHFGF